MTNTPPAPHSDELREIRNQIHDLLIKTSSDQLEGNPGWIDRRIEILDKIMQLFTAHRPTPAPVGDEGLNEILDDWLVHDLDCQKSLYDANCTCIAKDIKQNLFSALAAHQQRVVAAADEKAHAIGFKNGKWAMTSRINHIWLQLMTNEVGYEKAKAYEEAVEARLTSETALQDDGKE